MKQKLLALALMLATFTACGNQAPANEPADTATTSQTETVETNEEVAETANEATEEVTDVAEPTADEEADESADNDGELRKVTVVLDYTPNTNHTGLYAAIDQGFYEAHGLDVEIVQPPEDGAEALVASGRAEFGVSYQDSLANVLAGEAAMPITAIAAIIQHNTSGMMSRAGEGIDRPKGLEGKKYSSWNSPVEINTVKAVMEKDGGDFDKLNIIPAAPLDEVSALRENQTDAIWVFEGWGKVSADVQGYPVDYWNFADIDETLDLYSPVLIANNDLIANDKELVQAFVDASREGYEYAIANPKEAADSLLAADDALESEFIYASQEYLSKKYQDDAPKWGIFDGERWARYYNWLNENDVVEEKLDINAGWTNEFVE